MLPKCEVAHLGFELRPPSVGKRRVELRLLEQEHARSHLADAALEVREPGGARAWTRHRADEVVHRVRGGGSAPGMDVLPEQRHAEREVVEHQVPPDLP